MTTLAPAFLPGQVHRVHVELRAAKLDGNALVGYGAVYGQPTNLVSRNQWEQIAPGAFDAVLASDQTDVVAMWNHDPMFPLGRQSAGTLEVRSDEQGLPYRIELPNTSYANDLRELVARGDVVGSSIGFVPGKVTRSEGPDGRPLVTHTSVAALVDVSPVTMAAYRGTSVALRHAQILGRTAREQAIRARARTLFGG